MPESQESSTKLVPVYALQNPDNNVRLHFVHSGNAQTEHYEEAALISFVYNLTEKRRAKPSIEPELTIYKNLRPWKTLAIPKYVVVVDQGNMLGALVIAWDNKKSLQGKAPWGHPVVGVVTGNPGKWEVVVDPVQIEILEKTHFIEQKTSFKERETTPVPEIKVKQAILEALFENAVKPPEQPPETAIPESDFYELVAYTEEAEIENDPAAYTGDPFTVNTEGHFVGQDGFVVPRNFDEFYTRYPNYVLNWVKRRLNRFFVDDDVEDWTQDLLIHMKFLPQSSKHRIPGANGRVNGCSDIVETFNPYQQYGASKQRFQAYINRCIGNKFNTMQNKRQKNPVCRSGNLIFGVSPNEDTSPSTGDEFIHLNSSHLAASAEQKRKQHSDRLFTNQFKQYVKKEDPSVYLALEALEVTGPLSEAAAYMGVTEQEFARYRVRLKQLGDCFIKDCAVPKKRKRYKKKMTTVLTQGENHGKARKSELGQA